MIIFQAAVDSLFGVMCLLSAFSVAVGGDARQPLFGRFVDLWLVGTLTLTGSFSIFSAGMRIGRLG